MAGSFVIRHFLSWVSDARAPVSRTKTKKWTSENATSVVGCHVILCCYRMSMGKTTKPIKQVKIERTPDNLLHANDLLELIDDVTTSDFDAKKLITARLKSSEPDTEKPMTMLVSWWDPHVAIITFLFATCCFCQKTAEWPCGFGATHGGGL